MLLCYTNDEMEVKTVKIRNIWMLLCALVSLVVFSSCGKESQQSHSSIDLKKDTITISSAASLQEAMTEVRNNFAKKEQIRADQIILNFAGSGTLRQQIEQGAPVFVFVSADMKQMELLQQKGMVQEMKPLVENSLVLVHPKSKVKYTWENLSSAEYISIGTPETVPAGRYAMDIFQELGIWNQISSKVVYAKDVRAVLAQVSQGVVSAGVVDHTDAIQAANQVEIGAMAPVQGKALYPAGLLKGKESALAKAFYTYLFSEEVRPVLEKYGFKVVK